jgi:hypothetical protein
MNAIILKGAALRQPPLPQSGLRAKTLSTPGLDHVGSLTSHNTIGLHGLLRG